MHVAERFLELLETVERVVTERVSESGADYNSHVLDRVVVDFYHMILAVEVTENRVGIGILHLKRGLDMVEMAIRIFHPGLMLNIVDVILEDIVSELTKSLFLFFFFWLNFMKDEIYFLSLNLA